MKKKSGVANAKKERATSLPGTGKAARARMVAKKRYITSSISADAAAADANKD